MVSQNKVSSKAEAYIDYGSSYTGAKTIAVDGGLTVGATDSASTEERYRPGQRTRLFLHQVQSIARIQLLAVDRRWYQAVLERQQRRNRV